MKSSNFSLLIKITAWTDYIRSAFLDYVPKFRNGNRFDFDEWPLLPLTDQRKGALCNCPGSEPL